MNVYSKGSISQIGLKQLKDGSIWTEIDERWNIMSVKFLLYDSAFGAELTFQKSTDKRIDPKLGYVFS